MMLLCLSMFTGCTTNKNDTNTNDTNTTTNNDTVDDWYSRFETEMKNKNLNYTSKDVLDASSLGGKEGYRYVTENGNVDIYRFENSEELNKIMKDKKIRIDEQDRNVEVNDKYVIVSDGLSDDIMNIFRNMK